MYPRNHGVWSNGVLAKDEGKTLPHYLRRQGYQTANVGKMHFEPTGDPTGTMSAEAKVHWQRQADHEIEQGYWGFDTIKCTIGHSVVTGNYRQCLVEYRNGFGDQDFCVYALINKNYKFIRYEDGTYELNDLEKDKEERQNVASQSEYQDVVQQMTNNLLSYLMQTSTNRFPQICGN
ncbi:MAG: DUF4976 domain-containing protein [Niameybacter sp.]|uniref:sulfatase/phosphatase domain-containing protein n=1 Tax=Niameybacter sp. TaxID=2033640 RepID=UPI002FCACDAE